MNTENCKSHMPSLAGPTAAPEGCQHTNNEPASFLTGNAGQHQAPRVVLALCCLLPALPTLLHTSKACSFGGFLFSSLPRHTFGYARSWRAYPAPSSAPLRSPSSLPALPVLAQGPRVTPRQQPAARAEHRLPRRAAGKQSPSSLCCRWLPPKRARGGLGRHRRNQRQRLQPVLRPTRHPRVEPAAPTLPGVSLLPSLHPGPACCF